MNVPKMQKMASQSSKFLQRVVGEGGGGEGILGLFIASLKFAPTPSVSILPTPMLINFHCDISYNATRESSLLFESCGWSGGAMVLDNYQCWGVRLIWIIIR